MNQFKSITIWIVVQVQSGIPVLAEVFQDETTARNREKELQAEMNPENDEVGVFSSQIILNKENIREI